MINAYDFEDADKLRASVAEAPPRMVGLVERAREQDVRTIFVNDNHGAWHHGRRELVEDVLAGEFAELVEPIAPGDDVDFAVKARHSIFYETPLEYLLRQEGIERIILVGRRAAQRLSESPGSSARQNAATRRAASWTSESWTISTGECM